MTADAYDFGQIISNLEGLQRLMNAKVKRKIPTREQAHDLRDMILAGALSKPVELEEHEE